MSKEIETALGFNFGEIERRVYFLKRDGIEELEIKLKDFEGQPWPFLLYFAHYSPSKFSEMVHNYHGYDGGLNSKVFLDKIREHYIISKALSELREERKLKAV